MKILLFDIDGTLLYTGGSGKIAFERVFSEFFGVEHVWGNLIPDGKTDPCIVQELAQAALKRSLNGEECGRLERQYLIYCEEELLRAPNFRLVPGVEVVLQHLSQKKDCLLGLATGNFEEAGWSKLERGGIRQYFQFGGFGSDSSDRLELTQIGLKRGKSLLKAGEKLEEVYLIGDTEHDLAVGKKIGAKTIAIATTEEKMKRLKPLQPDYLFKDFTPASQWIEIFS